MNLFFTWKFGNKRILGEQYQKSSNNRRNFRMTVAVQVKTCLASLKSAQSSLEQFALNTQNQAAKTMFEDASKATQQIVDTVSMRVGELENEEPQYKGL
jgi:hypothetical protein